MPDARLLTERGRGFPLKRRFVAALAVFALFSLQASEIAVVAPGSGFGQNLGKHMVRWLGQNNVAADLVDEKTVSTCLKGKRLALLVMPKDAQLAAQGFDTFTLEQLVDLPPYVGIGVGHRVNAFADGVYVEAAAAGHNHEVALCKKLRQQLQHILLVFRYAVVIVD